MYFLNRNEFWPWWGDFINSPYTISIAISLTFLFLMFVPYKLFIRFCDNKNLKNYIYIYIYTTLSFLFISPLLFLFFNSSMNLKNVYYIFIIFACIELLYFYFIPIILKLIRKFPKLKSIFKFKSKSNQNNISQSN